MQKVILYILLFFLPVGNSFVKDEKASFQSPLSECRKLYYEMRLDNIINYAAFEQAIIGYNKIDEKNKDIITLIDYSKPSTEKRLYVIDMKQKKLLYASLVSHGRNSGENYATSFSNENGSYKSSLGFYLTESTYQGKNGYSLVLNGLEKGINNRAKERAIVMHAAPYCNPSFLSNGRLGRSQGCPALPEAVSKSIINTIKGGSLLYIYADNEDYLQHSRILSDPPIAFDGRQEKEARRRI
ncbi:murein L,D-transpeptidase catalytic domain family protein [Parabacteroides sp. Marseille-P3160]|uniref:murein L,D-transpeptidase catalytic domain family protein n=1 Tax=Parabacteroides sp. Marseille-P3160 TaxID=1917887 RepID=UPI0009BA01DF|nr:murein L,D-transpeptidase catalytic domain family protein [Parabacteroides sp. Marseille-P3160]